MTIVATGLGAALAAAILLAAPSAWAQTAAPTQPAPTVAPAQPTESTLPSPEERVEAYLAKLHAELQITPAQEARWRRYAAVIRQNARDMQRAFAERTGI